MKKSVNKLMYYPLRDDIPCRRVLKSKARANDKHTQFKRTDNDKAKRIEEQP